MIEAEDMSQLYVTEDTTYLIFMAELWGVYCEDIEASVTVIKWTCREVRHNFITVVELVFFIHDMWFSFFRLRVAMRLRLIQWSTKQSNFIITRSPFSKILTKPSSIGRVWTVPSSSTLQWRHNDHGGVPNHQPHGCLFNRIFRRRSKKTSKLRVTGLFSLRGIRRDRWIPRKKGQ